MDKKIIIKWDRINASHIDNREREFCVQLEEHGAVQSVRIWANSETGAIRTVADRYRNAFDFRIVRQAA